MSHLTKKGSFWKSQAPAIHTTVLKYKLHVDEENVCPSRKDGQD